MAAPPLSAPMQFLHGELQSDDVAQCVETITRLRTIGLALGSEKTRSELIPYLTREIADPEQSKFSDEVKVIIAEVLGLYVEFVGGPSEGHCLLAPLVQLCSAEESTVRDNAVTSINTIGNVLSKKQLQEHLLPAFNALSSNTDWFTPRVSACGLCALAYTSSSDEDRKAVVATFCSLAADESPMVRRAAASKLAGFAAVLEKEHLNLEGGAMSKILTSHKALIADEQESVRVNAVKAIPAICQRVVSLGCDQSLVEHTLQVFRVSLTDKSWRVRNACADVIAEVAAACSGVPDTHALLQGFYLDLATDNEAEVKVAAALKGDLVAAALGPTFGAEHVFQIVNSLVTQDPNAASRVDLAEVLAKLAAPLGKAYTEELILPQIDLIASSEENMNVRLAVINQLGGIIDVVGLQGQPSFLALISKLGSAEEKKWRIRHAIVLLLPKLASEIGALQLGKNFDLRSFAMHNFALIREDFATVLLELTRVLGVEWLANDVLEPIFADCAKEKAYQIRTVVLSALVALADYLDQASVEERLFVPALGFLSDKAPNLRIKAVEALAAVAKVVPALQSKIAEPFKKLTREDEDVDVKMYAERAIDELGL